jgi:hypothetical protein
VVDRLESVLTKFYGASEGPEWQAIWDQVHAVLGRTTNTPVDRCRALAVVLQDVKGYSRHGGTIPVIYKTAFNLKTAKALGLIIPETLLAPPTR